MLGNVKKENNSGNPDEINEEFEKLILSHIQKQKVFLYICELRNRLTTEYTDDAAYSSIKSLKNVSKMFQISDCTSENITQFRFKKLLEKFESSADVLGLLRSESKDFLQTKTNPSITKRIANLQKKFIFHLKSDPETQNQMRIPVAERVKEIEKKISSSNV